ncbi:MAG: pectate lyase [Acidobacteriota bacterium]|nr:pectate lyase [Acidobacteriota bacterium]
MKVCLWAVVSVTAAQAADASAISWSECLRQPPEWYNSDEAVRIADNVLLYQRDTGGWPKNINMAAVLSGKEKAKVAGQKKQFDSTIDNRATYSQLAYLARVYTARKLERLKDGFLKGVDFLLESQYVNGGFPQSYPKSASYSRHITYNDDAMIGALSLLHDIARKEAEYSFVDEDRRRKAVESVGKGIDCILKTQIVVDGMLTVWCAQHDEKTLAPTSARAFEKVSLSGVESVGITRFLMSVDQPSPQVIAAVQAAIAWFEKVKLTGLKWVEKTDASKPGGFDRIIVQDSRAAPLWARFYEIGTNRPIFAGRDGVIKYNVTEIEHERRTGYQWYSSAPARLLDKDYPSWRKKLATQK